MGRTPEEDDDSYEQVSPRPGSPSIDIDKAEESESSEDEDEEEFTSKKRFDGIIADLKKSDLKKDTGHYLRDPAKLEVFAKDAPWLVEKTTGDGDHTTLLHMLVDEAKDKVFEKYEPLISLLLKISPNLLREKDTNEKTPLYIAISKKREKLVSLMCTTDKDIDSALRIACYQSNCIHQGIKRSVAPKLMIFLINLSSKETLCAKDDRGNTPLHLAVDFDRCVDSQLEIVKAYLQKCDVAMDERTNGSNPLSPYQYHEYTRILALKVTETELRAKAKETVPAGDASGKEKAQVSERTDPKAAFNPKGGVPLVNPGSAAAPGMEPPLKMFSMRRSNTGIEALSENKALLAAPARAGDGSIDGKSVSGGRSRGRSSRAPKEDAKATDESAKAIKDFLKLHCLRTRNDDEAVDFLYGKRKEKEIYFDLYDTPNLTISEERMLEGFKHLEFEDVLQYVALPRLHVERLPVYAKLSTGKKALLSEGQGRKDMEFIFDFLRRKQVTRVIRVIVNDMSDPSSPNPNSHSDESIEICLGGLNVEVWDWRKTDLCTETIYTAAPDVRELSLYWSGNNAVLRSWSERDGLAILTKLKLIHLHIQQGLETTQRTHKNIKDFKKRLKLSLPDVEIDIVKEQQSIKHDPTGSISDASNSQAEPGHKWLSCMDEFSDFIQNVSPPMPIQEPITIALIDDGVDVSEQSLHARIIGGRSFCQRDRGQNLSMPYYVSTGGHGTVMASLICRICPSAQLYVVKLDEYMGENGKRQITAKSAEKAVRAAIAKGVHIISMSWTIEKTASNSTEVAGLESAIEAAAKAGILMFCAANDQGIARDLSFPSAASTKHIFKIGAAEPSGAIYKMTGDPADVDFLFPGTKILKDRPSSSQYQQTPQQTQTNLSSRPLDGSSVATAFASGLAALILYCIQFAALHTISKKLPSTGAGNSGVYTTMEDFRQVKGHERMREAFLAIGTSGGGKYIEVWNIFEGAVGVAERGDVGRVDIVVGIAGRLRTTKKYG